jgi:hypothetical protein
VETPEVFLAYAEAYAKKYGVSKEEAIRVITQGLRNENYDD